MRGRSPPHCSVPRTGAEAFELVRGLWDHLHRPWLVPSGGGLGLHTILPAREQEDARR